MNWGKVIKIKGFFGEVEFIGKRDYYDKSELWGFDFMSIEFRKWKKVIESVLPVFKAEKVLKYYKKLVIL